ncbi:hypothetical protein AWC38_SpisGene7279 [Stylophora pistillata]|uniref:YqaJ viral recombinase domain-containing protein n=1 Tax=Stylophora pistillata TaxID=50429 RepID=A0A2B4SG49_STYPI|nr:hypothetical protein AWC38_SpisGene7279 [Stylophora pistillata]
MLYKQPLSNLAFRTWFFEGSNIPLSTWLHLMFLWAIKASGSNIARLTSLSKPTVIRALSDLRTHHKKKQNGKRKKKTAQQPTPSLSTPTTSRGKSSQNQQSVGNPHQPTEIFQEGNNYSHPLSLPALRKQPQADSIDLPPPATAIHPVASQKKQNGKRKKETAQRPTPSLSTPTTSRDKSTKKQATHVLSDDEDECRENVVITTSCDNMDCKLLLLENKTLKEKVKKLQGRLDAAVKAKSPTSIVAGKPAAGIVDRELAAEYQMKEFLDWSGIFWYGSQRAICSACTKWEEYVNLVVDIFFPKEVLRVSCVRGLNKGRKLKDTVPLCQPIVEAIIGSYGRNCEHKKWRYDNLVVQMQDKEMLVYWLMDEGLMAKEHLCPMCAGEMTLTRCEDRWNSLKWECRKQVNGKRHKAKKANSSLEKDGYEHQTVNHLVEFVNIGHHTNKIEGHWRHAKCKLPKFGVRKHLFSTYLAEFMWRRNLIKTGKGNEILLDASFMKQGVKVFIKGFNRQHILAHVELLQGKDKPPPFAYLLSDQEPSMKVNTVLGNVTPGSTLPYQLQDFGRPNTPFHSNAIGATLAPRCARPPCTSFPKLPFFPNQTVNLFNINELSNLTNLDLQAATTYFQSNVAIDLPGAQSQQKRTVLQGVSREWLDQHKIRVTASNFGKVYHRVQRPSQAMMRGIFSTKDISKVKAIAHGKAKEKVARSIYARNFQKQSKNFAVFDAGISVNPSLPYLGASPDGKIYDPLLDNCYGLLEIKCPFAKRSDTLEQATSDPSLYLEKKHNNYYLKKDHSCGYYAQVQGQMALTGLEWRDFCVYLSDSNEMCMDRIRFDSFYWLNQLLPKLSDFYLNNALGFLVVQSQSETINTFAGYSIGDAITMRLPNEEWSLEHVIGEEGTRSYLVEVNGKHYCRNREWLRATSEELPESVETTLDMTDPIELVESSRAEPPPPMIPSSSSVVSGPHTEDRPVQDRCHPVWLKDYEC